MNKTVNKFDILHQTDYFLQMEEPVVKIKAPAPAARAPPEPREEESEEEDEEVEEEKQVEETVEEQEEEDELEDEQSASGNFHESETHLIQNVLHLNRKLCYCFS